jgi:hypothetical protein
MPRASPLDGARAVRPRPLEATRSWTDLTDNRLNTTESRFPGWLQELHSGMAAKAGST